MRQLHINVNMFTCLAFVIADSPFSLSLSLSHTHTQTHKLDNNKHKKHSTNQLRTSKESEGIFIGILKYSSSYLWDRSIVVLL